MEKEFVPYELSLKMKELGFNEPCFGYFTKYEEFFYFDVDDLSTSYTKNMDNLMVSSVDELKCSAPTISQAFNWIREKYKIYGIMKPILGSKNGYDSFPILGWDSDIFVANLDTDNSYYMGYPIREWFTATSDLFENGETLSDYGIEPMSYEKAEITCLEKLISQINFLNKK